MSNLTIVNGKVVKKAVVADATGVKADSLSIVAHKAHAKAILKEIHAMVPVIEGIILRAKQDKDTQETYLIGERFNTAGSNNPNSRALMEYLGDFDKEGQPIVQLSHWDENEKCLVPDYSVKCNDKDADRVYVETKSHTLVVYARLEADLRKIMKNASDAEIREEKNKLVDAVENMGLRITNKDRVYIANKSVEGTHLTVLNWSPSNMRSETQLMTRIQPDTAFKIMDDVSGGALSQALKGKLSVSKLIKASARLGILSAPSVEMVDSANDKFGYVIVLDKILGPQDYDKDNQAKLDEIGIEIDDNTSDGSYCISVEMLQASFAKLGRRLPKAKVLLFAAQTRANKYFTKVFGEAKTQKNMQYRLKRIVELYGEDKVLRVAAGTDVSGLNKKDYKAIVVGNVDCLGCIIDENGGKLLKNIDLQTIVDGNVTTHLLDIAKCSETKTSGQMLAKFLVADKEATVNALLDCMVDAFDKQLDNMLNGDVDAHKSSLAQFILRYAEGGQENTAALEALISEQITLQKSMVYKSRVDIKAYFQRALFDDTFFLTNGKVDSLLARNKYSHRLECYSRDIEAMFVDEIEAIETNTELSTDEKDKALAELLTGVAFKYPSPSSDENAIVTYVTRRQLKDRIEALDLDKEVKAILKDDFLNTSYGVTKLGADNTLKHKLAGMDTDYDGIAVVFERKLVDILLAKYADNDGLATIIC